MRSMILLTALLTAAPAIADWTDYDYEEERKLAVDASGLKSLRIEAGAGSLDIRGDRNAGSVEVRATILVDGARDEKAREFIKKRMVLTLERSGDRAELIADFRNGMSMGKSGAIALEISMPAGIDLDIDDGSGSIKIQDTRASVLINDGSGSISVHNVADVRIDDGSGSIVVVDAAGDVHIDDGSGSIKVERVAGSIVVDDGSGSINVSDVQGSLSVVDAGSGNINYSNIAGEINVPEH